MIAIESEVELAVAHRLMLHSGKCQFLHGHNYTFRVQLTSATLNADGMVMDFSRLKAVLDDIKKLVDHKTVLQKDDPVAGQLVGQQVLLVDYHPTAESMIEDFVVRLNEALTPAYVREARLYETSRNCAVYAIAPVSP